MNTENVPWSIDQMYIRYKTPLFHHIYSLVGDRELAHDLTQETFLKAIRALPRMGADLKVSAWLYRIATNTSYDALRRLRRIDWLPLSLTDTLSGCEENDPQEEYAALEIIREALNRMPEQYRIALLLRIRKGYTNKEIARALGLPETGSQMVMFRARKSFKEHYQALNREIQQGTPDTKRPTH